MRLFSGYQLAEQRCRRSFGYGDVGIDKAEHFERIIRYFIENLVAANRGNPPDLQLLRMSQRKQNGNRVIMPRIAVNNDRCWHRRRSLVGLSLK
ncbi:hypothetical protein D3C73_1046190 [compost metagenome]